MFGREKPTFFRSHFGLSFLSTRLTRQFASPTVGLLSASCSQPVDGNVINQIHPPTIAGGILRIIVQYLCGATLYTSLTLLKSSDSKET